MIAIRPLLVDTSVFIIIYVMLCSLAILDLRVGHTMDVLSPFIPFML